MNTPDRIWLIDVGDEITWCDCPDPSGYIEERDVVEYVKAEKIEQLQKDKNRYEKFLDELWGMGTVGKLKTEKDVRDLSQNMRNKIRAFRVKESKHNSIGEDE